jgi:hypothetical protein
MIQQMQKTLGQQYESLAFNFCKAATIVLITQKYALPIASGLAAIFYFLTVIAGQKETRCWLRFPLLIGVFWASVCGASIYLMLHKGP